MLPEKYRDVAMRIRDLHNANEHWQTLAGSRYPNWWNEMLTSLVVAADTTDPDEVEWVSVSVKDDLYKVAMITTQRLALGKVSGPDKDAARHSLTVASRSGVESVKFSSRGSAFGSESFASWPDIGSMTLRHSTLDEICIPLDEGPMTGSERDRLFVLLQGFLGQVGQPSQ